MTDRRQASTGPETMSELWTESFAKALHQWHTIESNRIDSTAAWREQLVSMSAAQIQLQQQGLWARGPTDLMTVCGFHRKELAHSSALRWLSDPWARHGLGNAFLIGLLAATGDVPVSLTDAEADTEVARAQSRADLVVRGNSWTLVAELKINAGESDRQCQRLFEDWRAEPNLRLVFITPSGRMPMTTTTEVAARAWICMSWTDVLKVLEAAIEDGNGAGVAPAVEEYRRTLRRLTGRRHR